MKFFQSVKALYQNTTRLKFRVDSFITFNTNRITLNVLKKGTWLLSIKT